MSMFRSSSCLTVLLVLAPSLACSTTDNASAPANASQTDDKVAQSEARVDPAGGGEPGGAPPPPPSPSRALEDEDPKEAAGEADPAMTDAIRNRDLEASQLTIGEPVINGGLDRDIIRRIANDGGDELRSCHGQQLRRLPDLSGTLIVTVHLDAEGGVKEAEIGEASEVDDPTLERCVLDVVRGWQFPAPEDDDASVELSFDLVPS